MVSAPTPEQHLLDTLRADEATVRAAEVRKIRTAIEWAVAHEVLSLDDASFHAGFGEHGLTLAGPGAPLVGENAVTELSVALGSVDRGWTPSARVCARGPLPLPPPVGGRDLRSVSVVAGQARGRGDDEPV